MEHFQWVIALTRVISAVFRKGGDVTFLVAEIGAVIEKHLKAIGLLDSEEMS